MNSKSIVWVVLAIWSLVCWRWYVCGMMDACGAVKDKVGGNLEPIQATEPMETAAELPPTVTPQPTTNVRGLRSSEALPPPSTSPLEPKVSPSYIDEVQMERVEDRMVIYFPYKSSRKEDNAAIDAYLSNLARQLTTTGQKVTITGHTDFVGEPADNYHFGLRRAWGIRDILVKKGVPKTQIKCKSFGDRKPVATNDTPYGRYLNRRAEIRVHN